MNNPNPTGKPTTATLLGAWFTAAGRGLALFCGFFMLLNVVGELRFQGYDGNSWLFEFQPVRNLLLRVFLALAAYYLFVFGLLPKMAWPRRIITLLLVFSLFVISAWNTVHYYVMQFQGFVSSSFPVPYALMVFILFLWIFLAVAAPLRYHRKGPFISFLTILFTNAAAVGLPLMMMYGFGKTDYRRPVQAVVVFGARVYNNGGLSGALADRTHSGCRLYLDGLAKYLIFSGGPGDGAVSEPVAMQSEALEMGLPSRVIILDPNGVNTRATVLNTCSLFKERKFSRVIAVSHFYHLPRIKLLYLRQRCDVLTVPANEEHILRKFPYFIMREVAALWVFYLHPLIPDFFYCKIDKSYICPNDISIAD